MTDVSSILNLIEKVIPKKYTSCCTTHVKVSFEVPEYSADVNGLGTLRILEAIRSLNLEKSKILPSALEMFGKTITNFQNEKQLFTLGSDGAQNACSLDYKN